MATQRKTKEEGEAYGAVNVGPEAEKDAVLTTVVVEHWYFTLFTRFLAFVTIFILLYETLILRNQLKIP